MKKLLITKMLVLSSLMMKAPASEKVDSNVDRLSLSEELSEDLHIYNVKRYMDKIGLIRPDIVIKQVSLETDKLRSNLCVNYNNLTGMNYPRKRPTTAIGWVYGDPHPVTGKKRKKAVFASWKDSIKDYLLYQKYWESKGKDLSNYWIFLKQLGYSETSGYIEVLKNIKI